MAIFIFPPEMTAGRPTPRRAEFRLMLLEQVRTLILLFIVLSLPGCGASDTEDSTSEDNHGYGWHYDAEGASGLRLRYSEVPNPDNPRPDVGLFESNFSAVQACAGISAPPPFVIIVPFGSLPKDIAGRYFSAPPLIVIYGRSDSLDYRHELIHHLLYHSTGVHDANHASHLFKLCASAVDEFGRIWSPI